MEVTRLLTDLIPASSDDQLRLRSVNACPFQLLDTRLTNQSPARASVMTPQGQRQRLPARIYRLLHADLAGQLHRARCGDYVPRSNHGPMLSGWQKTITEHA